MTNNDTEITDIRSDIDRVDAEIMRLLAERKAYSLRIAREKGRVDRPSRDQVREEDLIADRIAIGHEHDLDSGLIVKLWRAIVNDSVRVQQEALGRGEATTDTIMVAKPRSILTLLSSGIPMCRSMWMSWTVLSV